LATIQFTFRTILNFSLSESDYAAVQLRLSRLDFSSSSNPSPSQAITLKNQNPSQIQHILNPSPEPSHGPFKLVHEPDAKQHQQSEADAKQLEERKPHYSTEQENYSAPQIPPRNFHRQQPEELEPEQISTNNFRRGLAERDAEYEASNRQDRMEFTLQMLGKMNSSVHSNSAPSSHRARGMYPDTDSNYEHFGAQQQPSQIGNSVDSNAEFTTARTAFHDTDSIFGTFKPSEPRGQRRDYSRFPDTDSNFAGRRSVHDTDSLFGNLELPVVADQGREERAFEDTDSNFGGARLYQLQRQTDVFLDIDNNFGARVSPQIQRSDLVFPDTVINFGDFRCPKAQTQVNIYPDTDSNFADTQPSRRQHTVGAYPEIDSNFGNTRAPRPRNRLTVFDEIDSNFVDSKPASSRPVR
jgi:hypothetical protein